MRKGISGIGEETEGGREGREEIEKRDIEVQ